MLTVLAVPPFSIFLCPLLCSVTLWALASLGPHEILAACSDLSVFIPPWLGSLKSVCISVNSPLIKLSVLHQLFPARPWQRQVEKYSCLMLFPGPALPPTPPHYYLCLLRTHCERRSIWSEEITHLPVFLSSRQRFGDQKAVLDE